MPFKILLFMLSGYSRKTKVIYHLQVNHRLDSYLLGIHGVSSLYMLHGTKQISLLCYLLELHTPHLHSQERAASAGSCLDCPPSGLAEEKDHDQGAAMNGLHGLSPPISLYYLGYFHGSPEPGNLNPFGKEDSGPEGFSVLELNSAQGFSVSALLTSGLNNYWLWGCPVQPAYQTAPWMPRVVLLALLGEGDTGGVSNSSKPMSKGTLNWNLDLW